MNGAAELILAVNGTAIRVDRLKRGADTIVGGIHTTNLGLRSTVFSTPILFGHKDGMQAELHVHKELKAAVLDVGRRAVPESEYSAIGRFEGRCSPVY